MVHQEVGMNGIEFGGGGGVWGGVDGRKNGHRGGRGEVDVFPQPAPV